MGVERQLLGDALGAAVGADAGLAGRILVAATVAEAAAVHHDRRHHQQALAAGGGRGVDDVAGAADVDPLEQGVGSPVADHGGEVDHPAGAAHRGDDAGGVGDVAAHQLDPRRYHPRHPGFIFPGEEEGAHRTAGGDEPGHHATADETAGAGDEDGSRARSAHGSDGITGRAPPPRDRRPPPERTPANGARIFVVGIEWRREGDVEVLELVATGAPLTVVLEAIVRLTEADAPGLVGSVLMVENGRLRHGAAPRLPAEYIRAIDGVAIGAVVGSCGTAAFRGADVFVEDIDTDPLWADFKHLALPHGLRACWSVPVFAPDHTVFGTLALYNTVPGGPSAELVDLLHHAAQLASIAIDRQLRHEKLIASEHRCRLIIEHAVDARVLMDATGRVTGWNPAAVEVFGWSEQAAMGQRVSELTAGGEAPAHDHGLTHYLAGGDGPILGRRIELLALHRDGHELSVELTVTAIEIDGKSSFSAFVRDLTAQKQAEAEMRQLQKMEALGQLSGGIAHDFNNVLAVVQVTAEMLSEDLTDPALRDQAQEILKACERGSALTRQILAFSRKQPLRPERIDLDRVVVQLDQMLRRLIGDGVTLGTRLAGDLGPVLADPGQIEQSIVNLVVNARDAMPRGGRIEIETANADRPGGPAVMLAVHDVGHGMTDEVRKHIFDPFFTTKDPGRGTGLGLTVIYGIVSQAGGTIEVDSTPGKGTSFRIYLPRAEA